MRWLRPLHSVTQPTEKLLQHIFEGLSEHIFATPSNEADPPLGWRGEGGIPILDSSPKGGFSPKNPDFSKPERNFGAFVSLAKSSRTQVFCLHFERGAMVGDSPVFSSMLTDRS